MQSKNDYILLLKESLAKLDEAEKWLKRSYGICKKTGIRDVFNKEEYDAFETLTSRFARTSDMILQKVFRNIDKLELEESGTFLDVLNRVEKRRLIASVDNFREIRELRRRFRKNRIVVAFPPARYSATLANRAHSYFIIGRKKLADSQFPDEVPKADGFLLKRPATWK